MEERRKGGRLRGSRAGARGPVEEPVLGGCARGRGRKEIRCSMGNSALGVSGKKEGLREEEEKGRRKGKRRKKKEKKEKKAK